MGGRAFIVTQSIKKLSAKLQEAVFNDHGYRRLSNDAPVSIERMKSFDRFSEENLLLYQDTVYKVITADAAVDVGLYEDKVYQNGNTRRIKSKALLKQRVITVSYTHLQPCNIHSESRHQNPSY